MWPQIREKIEVVSRSSCYCCDVVSVTNPLADNRLKAQLLTFSNADSFQLANKQQVFQRLGQGSRVTPRVYAYRMVPSRDLLEVLLEHNEGNSLERLIQERGTKKRFSPKRAYLLMRDTLEALSMLHSAGIAHGRISLKSIWLDGNNHSFKLAGDLTAARFFSKVPEEAKRAFAQDVFDLGITLLIAFSLDLSQDFSSLSENELLKVAAYKMSKYKNEFGSIASDILQKMLCNPCRREAAVKLNSFFSSVTPQSLRSSVPSSFPSVRTMPLVSESEEGSIGPIHPSFSISGFSNGTFISTEPEGGHRSTKDFETLFVQVTKALEGENVDNKVLTQGVQDVVEKLNASSGSITVSVTANDFMCTKCATAKLIWQQAILPCRHSLCKSCLNRTVTSCLHSASSISCPLDSIPFDPLTLKDISILLEPPVMCKLDEKNQANTCPGCGLVYEFELVYSEPVSITCPRCPLTFCSFCRKKAHIFSCSEWLKSRIQREHAPNS